MLYTPEELKTITPTFAAMNSLRFDLNDSLDTHRESFQTIFTRPNVSPKWLEKQLQQTYPDYPTGFFKNTQRRAERAQLSQQARNVMLDNTLPALEMRASSHTANPRPGATLGRPWCAFVSFTNSSHNQRLEQVRNSTDAAQKGNYLFSLVEAARKKAGIQSMKDLYDCFSLSDSQLVSRFTDLFNYTQLLHELEPVLKEKNSGIAFSEEQLKILMQYKDVAMDLHSGMCNHLDIIANPYYELLDTNFLANQDPYKISQQLEELWEEKYPNESSLGLSTCFESAFYVAQNYSRNLPQRMASINPDLTNATLGFPGAKRPMDPTDAFTSKLPVVARTSQGKSMVLLAGKPDRSMGHEGYLDQLLELTEKTDRWLFTGSRQFASLQRQVKTLNEYYRNNPQATAEELQAQTRQLKAAAQEYLNYKGITDLSASDQILRQGKNRREQTRLDLAFTILSFTQAQDNALGKEIDARNAKAAPRPKKISDKKEPVSQDGLCQTANKRLDDYINGKLTMTYNGKTTIDPRNVKNDLYTLAFQQALEIENSLNPNTGAFNLAVRNNGYDRAFLIFSRQFTNRSLLDAGLKNYHQSAVKAFLEKDGIRNLAEIGLGIHQKEQHKAPKAHQDQAQPKQAEKGDAALSKANNDGKVMGMHP